MRGHPRRAHACQLAPRARLEPGQYEVSIRYLAADGTAESRTTRLPIVGDEVELTIAGYFDADASLAELWADTVRRAPLGVEIRVIGEASSPGEPPPMELVNGTDRPLHVHAQAGVLGSVVELEAGGAGSRYARHVAGCGTGMYRTTVQPGASARVSEIAPIGPMPGLAAGRYRFVVDYEDAETLPEEARSSRRVSVELEVTAGAEPSEQWSALTTSSGWTESGEASYPAVSRPGHERPPGLAGARVAPEAPRIDGHAIISGRLSPEQPRHLYRLAAEQDGDVTLVRVFARCTASPCRALVGVMSGRVGDLGGSSGPLHRDPPAWSTVEARFRSYGGEQVLEVGCSDGCVSGEAEFYGGVQIEPAVP